MANIFDYIYWRGDLSYEISPFNEIDSLIFSRLVHLPLEGVDDENFNTFTPLNDFAINMRYYAEDTSGYTKNDIMLLDSVIKSKRYSNTKIAGVVSKLDYDEPTQFAAVTFQIAEDLLYVSFRGTDITIAGWKENINMLRYSPIPSQKFASEYLNKIAKSFNGKIVVGGHSKGGNLAIYSYLFADDKVQKRVDAVYNLDGPGFNKEVISEIKKISTNDILSKINNYLPKSSVVGVLLERESKYNVIKSDGFSAEQHDIYLWLIERDSFVYLDEISRESKIIKKTVSTWEEETKFNDMEEFVDSFINILGLSHPNSIVNLIDNRKKTILSLVNQKNNVDERTRGILNKNFSRFRLISQNFEKIIK